MNTTDPLFSEEKLQLAFTTGLFLPENSAYELLEFAKSTGWDSVAHLKLIAEIEKEFHIMMDTADMLAISSYPKAREIVQKYLMKQPSES